MSQSNTRYPIRLFRHASSSALNSNSYHHLSNSYLPDLSKDSALISPSNDIQPHIIEAKTGAQKLAFVLNPSKTGHSKSNSISGTNLSSFYIPSTSPKELPNKFIQLKRPTSSHHHSGLDSSNRKDMTRFALSRQRTKDSSKEMPMRVSSAFKRPPGLHASVLQTSDKEDDITNNLSCTLEGDHGMYTKESKNSHKEKIRRMNIIYKNIASSEKIRQTRSNMQTPSYDSSNRFFHHSGSPNQSFSKLTTFTGISNNKALFHETLLSTLKSPTQKRKKKVKEEPSSQTKKKSVNSL